MCEVTGTNVKVKLVTNPDVESITISLAQNSKCIGQFPTNQSWLDHNITKSRKQRTVRKQNPNHPTCNINLDLEQTIPPITAPTSVILTGRTMKDNDLPELMQLNYEVIFIN